MMMLALELRRIFREVPDIGSVMIMNLMNLLRPDGLRKIGKQAGIVDVQGL